MSSPYLIIHNQLRLNGQDMDLKNLLLLSDAMKYTGWDAERLNRYADKNNASYTMPFTKATVYFKNKLPQFAPKRITYANNWKYGNRVTPHHEKRGEATKGTAEGK